MKRLSTLNSQLSTLKKGFTLIELLIVIAVIGILAAVILLAIDPLEQLSRGRDAGRKSTIGQVGRALQAYFTVNSQYPLLADWTANPLTNVMVTSGEIRRIPVIPDWPAALGGQPFCTGGSNSVTNLCYKVDAASNQAILYTKMESKSERNRPGCVGTFAQIYFVYSTIDGRAGLVLMPAADPNGPVANLPQTFC